GITVAIGDALLWQKHLPHVIVILVQTLTFFGKVVFLCWFQMFVRWALPRFRYDQLMKLGWRMLLPAALGNVFLTGVIVLAVERASFAPLDQLQAVADVCNAAVALAMLVGFVVIVFGMFTPTRYEERRHAFKRALSKRLGKKNAETEAVEAA